MNIRYEETQYGFNYGAAEVSRACSDSERGWVAIRITTPKTDLQVYVTKTGKVRVYTWGGNEWKEKP